MDISVIIVNRNTRDLLRACLDSVRRDDSVPNREVIVVDNGSTDGSREMLTAEFPEVRVQWNDTNEGFARPNNDGMRMSSGRYVFLLNSDAMVERGSMGALLDFMDTHQHAGASGPRLVYPDGRLQRSVSRTHSLLTHLFDMLFLDYLFPHSYLFGGGEMSTCPYDPDRTQEVEQIMGAAFVGRREVIDLVGMFDEELSIYYNEMDWFIRMHEAAWQIWYVPTTTVVHHRGATAAQVNKGFERLHEMYYNVSYYFRKHYGVPGLLMHRVLLIMGFVVRLLMWTVRGIVRPSDHSRYMRLYSWKVLTIGLRLWMPIEHLKPNPEGT